MDIDPYRVRPGQDIDLDDWDPQGPFDFDDEDEKEAAKAAARLETAELNRRLEELQELLYAERRHKVLVVLQATDTGGKDGTIRHVFDGTNPQGVKVASFKKPSSLELSHDYLWRIHAHAPATGELTIFNRSHYEDVLVVRVHDLVPEKQWRRRYDHIVNFEQMLADEGTTIIKLYLHISKDEQAERLQSRLDEPHKNWKFDPGDLWERAHWDDYRKAFTEVLERTSTKDAPWYIVPANRKWFRNRLVSQILVDTLDDLDMDWPEPAPGLSDIVIE